VWREACICVCVVWHIRAWHDVTLSHDASICVVPWHIHMWSVTCVWCDISACGVTCVWCDRSACGVMCVWCDISACGVMCVWCDISAGGVMCVWCDISACGVMCVMWYICVWRNMCVWCDISACGVTCVWCDISACGVMCVWCDRSACGVMYAFTWRIYMCHATTLQHMQHMRDMDAPTMIMTHTHGAWHDSHTYTWFVTLHMTNTHGPGMHLPWRGKITQFSTTHAHVKRTGWRRLIGCLKLQVVYRKRATHHRALLQKMTYEDKASYDSTPPCNMDASMIMTHTQAHDLTHTHDIYTWHTHMAHTHGAWHDTHTWPRRTSAMTQ